MSFTAEVKDELSRIDEDGTECALAEISALVRMCGTLSFRGLGNYSLRISTETGAFPLSDVTKSNLTDPFLQSVETFQSTM